jgi:hypothetical protein
VLLVEQEEYILLNIEYTIAKIYMRVHIMHVKMLTVQTKCGCNSYFTNQRHPEENGTTHELLKKGYE